MKAILAELTQFGLPVVSEYSKNPSSIFFVDDREREEAVKEYAENAAAAVNVAGGQSKCPDPDYV